LYQDLIKAQERVKAEQAAYYARVRGVTTGHRSSQAAQSGQGVFPGIFRGGY